MIPPIADPPDTKYVKHERIQSERLTKFWGRPMYLGAHVLLPEGFDAHPDARYPLVINHGHFPHTIGGFRETPPDPNLKPEYSRALPPRRLQPHPAGARATSSTRTGRRPDFPRVLVVEIQHANPYYDDSYAVNSANLGPYGDAIIHELIPYLEKKYRGIGTGWARFMYGGSTGGWEAMAAQVFYPDDVQRRLRRLPGSDRLPRLHRRRHLQGHQRLLRSKGRGRACRGPGMRNYLGHVERRRSRQMNQLELVLGTKGRSGEQWDIWEAVYSPVGADGYPKRDLGQAHRRRSIAQVAEYWREHYDLSHILQRDWDKGLGKKLEGKIHLYVGDMDNYYLNNAVYLVEDFLKSDEEPGLRRAKWTTAIAPSTAGTATRRGPTPTRGCAITRCSSRRSPSGSARRRRPAPISRAGGTDAANSASTLARCTR